MFYLKYTYSYQFVLSANLRSAEKTSYQVYSMEKLCYANDQVSMFTAVLQYIKEQNIIWGNVLLVITYKGISLLIKLNFTRV